MQRVLRWDVPVDDKWHEVGAGRVVHVAARAHRERPGDLVEVWTLEGATFPGTDEPPMRSVIVVGTGHAAPENTEYIGTAVVPTLYVSAHPDKKNKSLLVANETLLVESTAGLVWHVFGAYGVMP